MPSSIAKPDHTKGNGGSSTASGAKQPSAFSLMSSLKGGATSVNDADSTARLREGLATTPTGKSSSPKVRSPLSPSMAPLPMAKKTNSFTSSSNYHQQQKQQQRKAASYRNAPKGNGFSPKGHRRQGSSGSRGRWNFPTLSPANSMDSDDQMSARESVATSTTHTAGRGSAAADGYDLKTTSFDDCYSPSTPGYHDAFTLLEGVERSTKANSNSTTSPQGGRAFFPSSPKRGTPKDNPSSPNRSATKGAPSSPSPHANLPQAAPHLKKKAPNSLFTQTTIDGSSVSSRQNSNAMSPNNNPSLSQSPPTTPPHAQSMPAPPSGSKPRPSPTKAKARSGSPLNFPPSGATSSTRAASPLRHPSPLSGASRVKNSMSRTLSKAKGSGHRSRSRSRGSGNYSDAVSKALEEDAAGREVNIIEKPKSAAGTSKSQEGIEVISSPSTPGSGRGGLRGRLRTRSPSPVRNLGSSKGAKEKEESNDPSLMHMDKDSTASTPSFFGGTRGIRGISPGRMKRTLKKRLQRPPQAKPPTSPEKKPLPLYPGSEGGKGVGSYEDDDEDGIDQITSLVHTTMSFDIDDNGLAIESTYTPPPHLSGSREKAESALSPKGKLEGAIQENGMDEDGYFINTTTFNIFESHEFLSAMGESVSEASLATNYIRTGDSLCDGSETQQQKPQFERAVQDYYAGLGVILTRIREWMVEQHGEGDIPCDTAEPEASDSGSNGISYKDLLAVAHSPETNILLLAISSILLRAGNAHFRFKKYDNACRDYASAETYRCLRHQANDIVSNEKTGHSEIHVEDVKLSGRISNNMASAQSKRKMYDEARMEYTKALQIKQGSLEALHRASKRDGAGAKKEIDDKHLVADIASTFHNIGLLRMECGEPKKAEKAYKQSLSLRVKKFGLDDIGVSSTLSALGNVYYHQKQYDDAFRSYKESLRIQKAHCGKKSNARVADLYYNIGLVFNSKGPFAKARTSVAECLRIRRHVCEHESLPIASALYLLGSIDSSSGNYVEAKSYLEEALAIRQKILHDQLLVLNVQLALGIVHQKQNDLDNAMDCFSIALEGRAQQLGRDHSSLSEVLQAIGVTYTTAGEYEKARQTLEEALRIRRASFGRSVEVAETLDSLSLVLFKLGDTGKAIELSREAIGELKGTAGSDHLLVGKTLKNAGDFYQDMEAYDDAMEAYSESLRVFTMWHGREHIFLAEVLNEIGVTRFKDGEFSIAKQSFTEALRLMRLSGNEANNSAIFPTLNHLGHALFKNNELGLATETYIESFNIQVSIVTGDANDGLKDFGSKLSTIKDRIANMQRDEEDVTEISESLGGIANILRYLGLATQQQGDLESALSTNKLSLSVRLCQPIRENSAIALMAETIAMFEYKRNNLASAMDYFHQALEAKKSYQGDSTIDVARTVNNLANIHFSLGNLEEAMELYQEALEIKKLCLGEDSDEVANTLNNIAHVMVNAGREQEALKAYHNVVKIRQDRYGKSHVSVAATLASMGDVYIKLGKLEIAMTYFEQCIRIQKLRQDHCDERVLENLGSIYGKLGEWHKAESTFREIIEMKRTAHGDDCLDVAKTMDLLAVSFIEQDRYADSIEHLQEALRIRKACLDEDDDEVMASLNKLAFVYKSLDMTEQMLRVRSEFDAIQARRRDASS